MKEKQIVRFGLSVFGLLCLAGMVSSWTLMEPGDSWVVKLLIGGQVMIWFVLVLWVKDQLKQKP